MCLPDYTEAFMLEIAHTEIAPGTVVVKLTGKVMMGTDSEPIVTLVDSFVASGKRLVIFDVSGVTRMDSTGVGRFIYSFNKISSAGGVMRMAGAVGHIFEIFHVSLLDTVIPFFPSLEEAEAARA
jgi:stage II sporulation protein AA (anti-sigma F factor antagonist)